MCFVEAIARIDLLVKTTTGSGVNFHRRMRRAPQHSNLRAVVDAHGRRHMEARMKAKRTAAVLLFVLAWMSHAYGQVERLTDAQIAGVVFVANQAEIAAGESALRRTQSRSVQALSGQTQTSLRGCAQ